jgi:uncharacterized membrane protein YphA (DoxX/SURF4 family)
MTITYYITMISSSVLFLWYGASNLFNNGMVDDFERFGLSRYRRFTGGIEMLGAIGLLAGLLVRPLAVVSAAGLSLLMLLGIIARIRVRDPLVQLMPAVFLMIVNAYLALSPLGHGLH